MRKRADAIWNKGPELIDDDGEVRELTAEDFRQMKPFSSLPERLQHILSEIQRGNVTLRPTDGQDDPPAEETVLVPVSISVAKRFEAGGEGWEGRVDAALREWLDEHHAS